MCTQVFCVSSVSTLDVIAVLITVILLVGIKLFCLEAMENPEAKHIISRKRTVYFKTGGAQHYE